MDTNKMPARIYASPREDLSSDYIKSGLWSDIPLNTSYAPYVRADLVRDAMEAMEHAAAPSLPSSKRRMAALSALSKLKEAGL